ncbi:MAG TPA: hypothetical protein VHB77_18070, partial [Planctomycetaceae bacterium]|nr:hypothetical protein [Planctomycetaceae bacterium]
LASAQKSIGSFPYDGFNLALIDGQQAFVVEAGEELRLAVLNRGIHVIANGDLNDSHDSRLARVRGFSETLRDSPWQNWSAEFRPMLGEHATEAAPPVCLHHGDRGTVSASVIALAADVHRSEYWYAPGPPCTTAFENFSPLLRDTLSTDPAQEQES